MTDAERQTFLNSVGFSFETTSIPSSPAPTSLTDAEREAFIQEAFGEGPTLTSLEADLPPSSPPSLLNKVGEVYENIAVRPAAAIRGGLQAMVPGGETPSEGYLRGMQQPASIPTFQSQALDAYYGALGQTHPTRPPSFGEGLMGNLPSALGFGADV